MSKKTLKFLEDAFYNNELVHKKGDIVELDDSLGYATRWLVYGMAEIVESVKIEAPVKIEEVVEENKIEEIVNTTEVVENKKSKKVKKS